MVAYKEILEFITSTPTLHQIIAFEHSRETIARVVYLQQLEAQSRLNKNEMNELREYRKAAHFIEQLKLRAERRLHLAS
jgi:hypothetical protein